jgi:hypothetical protein
MVAVVTVITVVFVAVSRNFAMACAGFLTVRIAGLPRKEARAPRFSVA